MTIGRIRFAINIATFLLLAGGLAAGQLAAAEEENGADGFRSMFNGRDLTGWEGAAGWWEVRSQAIVAESTAEKPSGRTHYLYWKEAAPADFELCCEYRITGRGGNSGIQFRSEARPNWDTWGYQADIDTDGQYVGCIYQHERGLVAQRGQKVAIDAEGKRTVASVGDPDALLKTVKPGEWNELRLVARGPRIAYWINGVLMCEVEDHEPKYALPRGIIALQMHQGPPMKIEFRHLRIRIDK